MEMIWTGISAIDTMNCRSWSEASSFLPPVCSKVQVCRQASLVSKDISDHSAKNFSVAFNVMGVNTIISMAQDFDDTNNINCFVR